MHNAAEAPPPPARQDLTFREAARGDAARYVQDIGTESETTFRRRLRDDVRCFLVLSGERIVHSSWLTTSGAWTREIAATIVPPRGDAYLYESFTAPDRRGEGIYPFALASILRHVGEEGVVQVWIGVTSDNLPSVRAIAKAGFVEAFRIGFSRRLGRVRLADPEGPRAGEASQLVQQQKKARWGRPGLQSKQ